MPSDSEIAILPAMHESFIMSQSDLDYPFGNAGVDPNVFDRPQAPTLTEKSSRKRISCTRKPLSKRSRVGNKSVVGYLESETESTAKQKKGFHACVRCRGRKAKVGFLQQLKMNFIQPRAILTLIIWNFI